MSDHTEERGFTGGHNPWAIALTVSLATFMEVLDTSIANVSLPHIAGDLSVSQDESTWVLTSYLVSNAIVLPVSGWLATRFGRKRFYMTSVVLFTVSSFLCGIAPSLGALVFFRVLQGIGGGGLAPSEQAILRDTFPLRQLGMAMAVYGMAVVLAPAIGPTLGGYITDHFSWRWVFFINIPVGLLSLALSRRLVVDPPRLLEARSRAGGIDYIGLGLIALGLGALEYVLDRGQELDWFAAPVIVAFSTLSAVALVSFVIWEWRQEHPVVEVRLFRSRSFAVSNLAMLVLGIALYGSTVLLPQYVQVWMGYSAQQAGMALSPGALVIVALMPVVGALVTRLDPRWLIAFGFVVLAASMFHMAHTLYPGIDFSTAVWLRNYQAVGLAFLFVPINTVVYVGIPPAKNNAVSGIVNLSRNMGGDIGIALVTTLIARRSQFHQANLVAHLDPGSQPLAARIASLTQALQHAGSTSVEAAKRAYGVLSQQLAQQAQTLAYADVLYIFACFAALMAPLVFLTKRTAPGAQVVGH
ncbi:MAG TPA: DHA2 family efflux MFS transporter permease subunit [Anaeromyxobacteraceae bacterium]|nr:DHA2 family efflux MFS transporter permease subunit [Anaeromyxobacteraceae bacterium]